MKKTKSSKKIVLKITMSMTVTQNDQVFQQAIATARHLELQRRNLVGANENILFDLLRSRLHDPR